MIIVANSAYSDLICRLKTLDKVILVPESGILYDGIRDHGDLHCFGIDGEILLSQEAQALIGPQLSKCGLVYKALDHRLGSAYPETALLNAAVLGNQVICNPKTVADEVLELAKHLNREIIPVKQGYTRCTTLPLINGCITDDPGIYKALVASDIDALLVDRRHVILSGHDYGFIGGCAGLVEKTVYFNGDITRHPDWERIERFCLDQGLDVWWIDGKPLRDVGSVLWFP